MSNIENSAQQQVWVVLGWQEVDGREPIVLVAASEEAAQMAWDEYVAEECDPANYPEFEPEEMPQASEFVVEYIAQMPVATARR